jgi:hypothetical protein
VKVLPIKYDETKNWLLNVHYLKRMPPISYSFGLFDNNNCVGIVTFGVPASGPLRVGICGKEWESNVFELNRMVLEKPVKNGCSRLVSGAIKLLPKPIIIVSYADTQYGHIGQAYQACNFIYTGITKERTDRSAGEGKHPRHAVDDTNRVNRSAKHRYVLISANKQDRKKILRDLNYCEKPYPKGTPAQYEINHNPVSQGSLL